MVKEKAHTETNMVLQENEKGYNLLGMKNLTIMPQIKRTMAIKVKIIFNGTTQFDANSCKAAHDQIQRKRVKTANPNRTGWPVP